MSEEKSVEENIKEVGKLVVEIRSEAEAKEKKYGEYVANNDTAILKMETKFGDLSEIIQKQGEAKNVQDETIRELTLSLAKKTNSVRPDGEIVMSEEVKSMFATAIRNEKSQYVIEKPVMQEIIAAHVDQSFSHLTSDKQQDLVKSILATGSNTAGGMWCPVPVDSRIRKRVWETSPMRQLAEVINVNTKAMKFALDDEDMILQARAEVDTVNPTDAPEFGEVRIDIHEISAKPKATLEVLEDSTLNLEAWLSGKVSSRTARQQNTAFISGDGIKTAKGILDYPDADVNVYERGAIGTAQMAGSLAIAGDDLIDLQSNLLEDYQGNANWMMHRLIWARVVKLKDLEGRYLLDPLMLFNGAVPQLLGAPVKMAGDMPSPAAGVLVAGTNYMAYGDFREGYTILDRLGINVIMDNITESGFVKWYFRSRYGGGVTNFQAIKRLKATA